MASGAALGGRNFFASFLNQESFSRRRSPHEPLRTPDGRFTLAAKVRRSEELARYRRAAQPAHAATEHFPHFPHPRLSLSLSLSLCW
jgi:hypothetical protein